MRKFAVGLVLSVIAFTAQAQDCSVLFQQANEKLRKLSDRPNASLQLKYSVFVENISGENFSEKIQIEMHAKRAKIISSEVTIYQDEKTMVVVEPESRTIFMTHPVDPEVRRNQLTGFLALQDSLFKYMKLSSCVADGSLTSSGSPTQKLTFLFADGLRQHFSIASATYWIDSKNLVMKRIQLRYADSSEQFKSLRFEFEEMNLDYRGNPFEGSALGKVMEHNRPKAIYQNYEIIDER